MTNITHPALLQAENEKLRGLLAEVAHCLRTSDEQPLYWEEEFASRIYRALSQQAEPTDTYTAVDMATAAAQGFRNGQAAMEPAPALDVHYSKGFTDQSGDCGKFEAGINVGTWMQRIVAYGDTAEDAERMRDVILEALARPAQTEQQPEQDEREAYSKWRISMEPYGFNGVDAFSAGATWQRTRPAQTEQQPAYVECRECTDCGHVGINDAHQTDATCAMCDWSGPSPVEDQCPDCGKKNVMGAACPKCSGRYRVLAETHVAAPIASAPQQSGWISVEDRLPEARDGTRYLVARDCGNGTLKSTSVGFLLGGEWHISDDVRSFRDMGYRVTHWQPLPAAPQGGE